MDAFWMTQGLHLFTEIKKETSNVERFSTQCKQFQNSWLNLVKD